MCFDLLWCSATVFVYKATFFVVTSPNNSQDDGWETSSRTGIGRPSCNSPEIWPWVSRVPGSTLLSGPKAPVTRLKAHRKVVFAVLDGLTTLQVDFNSSY